MGRRSAIPGLDQNAPSPKSHQGRPRIAHRFIDGNSRANKAESRQGRKKPRPRLSLSSSNEERAGGLAARRPPWSAGLQPAAHRPVQQVRNFPTPSLRSWPPRIANPRSEEFRPPHSTLAIRSSTFPRLSTIHHQPSIRRPPDFACTVRGG